MTIPDKNHTHPVVLPDGSTWPHTVFLSAVIDHLNIECGDYSYYNDFGQPDDYARTLAPYLHPGASEKLIIGKFVQIAHGVQFITSSANHQMDGISSYSFFVFGGDWAGYQPNFPQKGDTVIGHDVWLGHQALVMPGVTIGNGCIIGARSVVTRDVAPYSIVAGNPAQCVRMRFDKQSIAALQSIAWWDWDIQMITDNIQAIVAADIAALKAIGEQ